MPKSPTARSTIKNDPFAAVIPLPSSELGLPEESEVSEPPPAAKREVPTPQPVAANTDRQAAVTSPANRGKRKLTVHLSADLAERVKNAAFWEPRLTIGGIAEQGIKSAIERIERERGGKYPPRNGELTGGRPIK